LDQLITHRSNSRPAFDTPISSSALPFPSDTTVMVTTVVVIAICLLAGRVVHYLRHERRGW
jgi:hypothetical protein